MKKIFFVTLCFLFCSLCYSQNTIQKIYEAYDYDEGANVVETPDGGFLITGNTSSFSVDGADILLIKTNSTGEVEWAKTYGMNIRENALVSLVVENGDFVVEGNIGGPNYPDRVVLFKINNSGMIQWAKSYRDYLFGVFNVNFLKVHDNGFILGGATASPSANNYQGILLSKTDLNGNVQWGKNIYSNLNFSLPIHALTENSEHNILISSAAELPQVSIGSHLMLIKTDSAGNVLWNKLYRPLGAIGGNDYNDVVFPNCLLTLPNNDIVVCFYSGFFSGGKCIMITDKDGTIKKLKVFSSSAINNFTSIEKTSDHGFILTGRTDGLGPYISLSSNTFLLKIDNDLNIQWFYIFGGIGYDYGFGAKQSSDGSYYFTGSTGSCGLINQDIFLIKTDNDGLNDCLGYWGSLYAYDTTLSDTSIALIDSSMGSDSTIYLTVRDVNPITTFLCNKVEMDRDGIDVFPNPFTSETTISVKFKGNNLLCPTYLARQKLTFALFDMLGRKVRESDVSNDITNLSDRIEIKVQKGNLARAVYIWQLIDKNNLIVTTGKIAVM